MKARKQKEEAQKFCASMLMYMTAMGSHSWKMLQQSPKATLMSVISELKDNNS